MMYAIEAFDYEGKSLGWIHHEVDGEQVPRTWSNMQGAMFAAEELKSDNPHCRFAIKHSWHWVKPEEAEIPKLGVKTWVRCFVNKWRFKRSLWSRQISERVDVTLWWHPRDAWVGAYWDREGEYENFQGVTGWTAVYVCLLPFLPIEIDYYDSPVDRPETLR